MKGRPGQISEVLRAALAADVGRGECVALEAAALVGYEQRPRAADVRAGAELVAGELGLAFELSPDGRHVYFARGGEVG
jgi:hypothetical protein